MKKTMLVIFSLVICISMLTVCSAAKTGVETTFNLERKIVVLNNGIEMPILGLGTYLLTAEETENSVLNALYTGVRLIDTATASAIR